MSVSGISLGLTPTLIVCRANVCRSPAAAFAMAKFNTLDVHSVGMRARDGEEICATVSKHIRPLTGGSAYVEAFSARSIDSLDPRDFKLILTATASIRGELVQSHPELLDRTFTLMESNQLARKQLSPDETVLLTKQGPQAVLIQRRGTIPTATPKKAWFGKRKPPFLDLVDTHGVHRARQHRATIDQALALGDQLGKTLEHWNALQN